MKAVLLYAYGGVDQLRYETVADPVAAPGEVLVRVIATSVNPIDFKLRRGSMQGRVKLDFPVVLGRDVAGEVTGLGAGVTGFSVGDQVMGFVNHSYAEYLTAKAEVLTAIPKGLDTVAAGTLPLVALTGAQLIEKGVQPKPRDVVLVTGALGNVGRTAVFVAKQHGAVVIAGVRAKQTEQAQLLGVDAVVALDDDAELSELPELDAIADTVGGDSVGRLLPKLKKSGRLASVVGNQQAAAQAGVQVHAVFCQPHAERLYVLAEDVRDERLIIPIEMRLPLSEIRQAHAEAEKGGRGKIAVLPEP